MGDPFLSLRTTRSRFVAVSGGPVLPACRCWICTWFGLLPHRPPCHVWCFGLTHLMSTLLAHVVGLHSNDMKQVPDEMKQPRPDPRNQAAAAASGTSKGPGSGAMLPPAAAPFARFDPRVRSPAGMLRYGTAVWRGMFRIRRKRFFILRRCGLSVDICCRPLAFAFVCNPK